MAADMPLHMEEGLQIKVIAGHLYGKSGPLKT